MRFNDTLHRLGSKLFHYMDLKATRVSRSPASIWVARKPNQNTVVQIMDY